VKVDAFASPEETEAQVVIEVIEDIEPTEHEEVMEDVPDKVWIEGLEMKEIKNAVVDRESASMAVAVTGSSDIWDLR